MKQTLITISPFLDWEEQRKKHAICETLLVIHAWTSFNLGQVSTLANKEEQRKKYVVCETVLAVHSCFTSQLMIYEIIHFFHFLSLLPFLFSSYLILNVPLCKTTSSISYYISTTITPASYPPLLRPRPESSRLPYPRRNCTGISTKLPIP